MPRPPDPDVRRAEAIAPGELPHDLVEVGGIVGAHGVRGALRVKSLTDDPAAILGYRPWYLERRGKWMLVTSGGGRSDARGLIARLAGVDDRDAAQSLAGYAVYVRRETFPQLRRGEAYWADLLGMQVVTLDGAELGIVEGRLDTAAHDVMIVRGDRERLIPFVRERFVREIDADARRIVVDWHVDD